MSKYIDPFRSEEERIFWGFANVFPQLVPELEGLRVDACSYEAIRFDLGGTSYTPDFYFRLLNDDGYTVLAFIEVKGSKFQKGYRDTRTKLLNVSSLFPEYAFFEVMVNSRLRRIESVKRVSKKPFVFMSFLGGKK